MRPATGSAIMLLVLGLRPCVSASGDESVVVTATWLAAARQSLGSKLVIAEVSWTQGGVAREYDAGHVPGAIHIDTDVFENGSPRWHLLPPDRLSRALGELGIGSDSVVVVYSHQTVAAARVWWVMQYAGVADVRYLDGGLGAWKRAGFKVETTRSQLPPTVFQAKPREHLLAATDYVRERRQTAVLADVRSPREFRGETSGYSYLKAKGRIHGAVAAGDASDQARLYQNPDGTLRRVEEIRKLWQEAGLLTDDGREVIFYCGSGWRSSLALLYARLMGLHNVRNYSDGWSGWSTRYEQSPDGRWRQHPSSNPVARGR